MCARARVRECVCVCVNSGTGFPEITHQVHAADRLVEWMLVVGPDTVQSVSCAYVILYSACLSEKYGAHEHAFTCSFRRAYYRITETSSF